MNSKAYLFVGGPADGQRIVLPEGVANHFIPTKTPPCLASAAKFSLRATQTHYTLNRVRGETDWHEVFVPRGMSGDELILLLLLNYRPAK